jgi:hypothetical protein
MKSNDLLGIRYLKNDFKEREDCLFTHSYFLNGIKEELEMWNYKRYKHPRINKIKRETFYNTLKLSSKIYHSRKNMKKVLWIGPVFNRYNSLFMNLPYNSVISEIKPSLNSLHQLIFTPNISLYPLYSFRPDILSGMLNNDEDLLQQGLDKIKNTFKHINPDLIILESDHIPVYRAMTLAAREVGIPTVEIQHGIYMSDFVPTGREVDYVFVWGEHFKNLYLKKGIKKPDQIKILGYPFQFKKCSSNDRERKLVTYLGQSYENYNKDLIVNKVETIKNLQEICNKLGFDFVYRPHPSEDLNLLKSEVNDINLTISGETLQETFEKGDIFVAFNSTALVEANLYSKLSIQLKNYDVPTDDLEKLGACSKSVETFEELEKYLKQIKNGELSSFYHPVKESYIKISQDPERRFCELIKEII